MARQLTREDVASRLKSYQRDGYLYIGGFMKSVTFAAATIVLIEIFSKILSGGLEGWMRLCLWGVSLMATLVSYITWGRGTLLANSRGNLRDSIFPLFMGITEFLLFAVISIKSLTSGNPDIWKWWFWVIAINFLLGVLITKNRKGIVDVTKDFAPNLQALGEELAQWVEDDRKGAMRGLWIAGVMAIPAIFIPDNWRWVYFVMTIPFFVVFFKAIIRADKQRKRIEEVIFQESKPKRRASPRKNK